MVQKPYLCPKCSGFACKGCFYKWLESKKECPVCRASITRSQIVACKFLENISMFIHQKNNIFSKVLDNFDNQSMNKCLEHKLNMIYFCSPCQKLVCSDCVVFEEKHKNHKILRIREILESKLEELSKEYFELEEVVQNSNKYLEKLNDYQQTLTHEKDKRLKYLCSLFNGMKSQIEEEYQNKSDFLMDQKKKFMDKLDCLENFVNNFEKQMSKQTPIHIISKSSSIKYSLIKQKEIDNIKKVDENYVKEFQESRILDRKKQEVQIKNFTQIRQQNVIFYGKQLELNGNIWRLKVYPNGAGIFKRVFMSVFVELVKGWPKGGSYSYKITMKKHNRDENFEDNLEKEYVSDFENAVCWGYNRFFRIEDLENSGFLDPEQDILNLELEIGPSNLLQMCSDLKNYSNFLQENQKIKDSKIKALQQQVNDINISQRKFINKKRIKSLSLNKNIEKDYSGISRTLSQYIKKMNIEKDEDYDEQRSLNSSVRELEEDEIILRDNEQQILLINNYFFNGRIKKNS